MLQRLHEEVGGDCDGWAANPRRGQMLGSSYRYTTPRRDSSLKLGPPVQQPFKPGLCLSGRELTGSGQRDQPEDGGNANDDPSHGTAQAMRVCSTWRDGSTGQLTTRRMSTRWLASCVSAWRPDRCNSACLTSICIGRGTEPAGHSGFLALVYEPRARPPLCLRLSPRPGAWRSTSSLASSSSTRPFPTFLLPVRAIARNLPMHRPLMPRE